MVIFGATRVTGFPLPSMVLDAFILFICGWFIFPSTVPSIHMPLLRLAAAAEEEHELEHSLDLRIFQQIN